MKRKRENTQGELAKAAGVSLRTVSRWVACEGSPFDASGKCDVAEALAWAEKAGKLGRGKGRPSEVERLVAEATPAAAAPFVWAEGQGAPSAEVAAKAVERVAAALGVEPGEPVESLALLTEADEELLKALVDGDPSVLIQLATKVSPPLLKKLAAMGRTRRELAEAQRRELENRKTRRELVPIEDVRKFWVGQIETVKAHFNALPGKLAPRLVDKKYDEVYQVLEEELHALLEAFAQEVPA